jgi:hypothetical protein
MLTKADDYPLHQTPEPIAFAGSDRNFYDRYFFNGYSADGALFFAAAMGFYPQLGIADAAFSLIIDGVQHNIRASRHLVGGERMELAVGPIHIEIVEPLQQIRLRLDANDSGIVADMMFAARHAPIEEPRFTRRNATRLFMDYTRMTQNGVWSGSIRNEGETIALDNANIMGTRDRSWGIRPVGASDSQPPVGGNLAQFFWLWSPCNFADHSVFAHTNDDAGGLPWNRRAVIAPTDGAAVDVDDVTLSLVYEPGGRRLAEAKMSLGERGDLLLQPIGVHFYMRGLGYTHPTWGHGMDHGPLEIAYDFQLLTDLNDLAPENMHIQAVSDALLRLDGREYRGSGVLEQMLIGPHKPSRFSSLFDPAG